MTHWNEVIDLSGPWNSEDSYRVKRDQIVSILRGSDWIRESPELEALVDDLEGCRIITDFVWVFDSVYNLADRDRVWLKTWN